MSETKSQLLLCSPAKVGYGFMMGFSSGFALKKVSRIVAFGVGTIFILVQAMSYQGYINVNYAGIQKDIEVHVSPHHEQLDHH